MAVQWRPGTSPLAKTGQLAGPASMSWETITDPRRVKDWYKDPTQFHRLLAQQRESSRLFWRLMRALGLLPPRGG